MSPQVINSPASGINSSAQSLIEPSSLRGDMEPTEKTVLGQSGQPSGLPALVEAGQPLQLFAVVHAQGVRLPP